MKNILIVDDESINRLYISSFLKKKLSFPHNISQVNDGFWALDAAKKLHYDYVIMDYWMPWINWWETMKRLVQDMWWRWIGIWYTAYTAYDMWDVWQHFLDAWARKVFQKYSEMEDLLEFITKTDIRVINV